MKNYLLAAILSVAFLAGCGVDHSQTILGTWKRQGNIDSSGTASAYEHTFSKNGEYGKTVDTVASNLGLNVWSRSEGTWKLDGSTLTINFQMVASKTNGEPSEPSPEKIEHIFEIVSCSDSVLVWTNPEGQSTSYTR